MNQFQMAIAVMAFCDINGAPRDAEGRRRQYTTEELDALVDFRWPGAGIIERLARLTALPTSAFRRPSDRTAPVALPSANAPAQA